MRRSKYNVGPPESRTYDRDGECIVFDSRRERDAYAGFRLLEKNGKIARLERQVAFPLMAFAPASTSGVLVGKYVADFVVTELDGTRRIYDSKGVRTAMYKFKMKLFAANYPELRVVEI